MSTFKMRIGDSIQDIKKYHYYLNDIKKIVILANNVYGIMYANT